MTNHSYGQKAQWKRSEGEAKGRGKRQEKNQVSVHKMWWSESEEGMEEQPDRKEDKWKLKLLQEETGSNICLKFEHHQGEKAPETVLPVNYFKP